uniref:Radical S-adenosyl methionine domain-containing protein 1, mitochondrial n=1 Tax=Kalanchoe fedtschenkoi TaxID=63787 RepID=A0A7N0TJW0_KALFE
MLLLRSSFAPFFSTFPPFIRIRNLTTSPAHICSTLTVRQNAAPKIQPFQLPPTSAYVHLPFCRKRCHYCDFPIVALGSSANLSAQEHDPRISDYINLLCREIQATFAESDATPPLKTVFFGGGTPSLVPPTLVASVLELLKLKFGLHCEAEISMEMDPGTFDAGKLKALMELGVNRVSLGVQAFQDEVLKSCGRAHGVEQVYEAIEIVKSCGVVNWSMDLISSLPHQTAAMWDQSLRLAVEAQPAHVSVYDLQVEKGTKFGILYTPGEFPLPSDTQSADFYKMASTTLSDAGYNHYEISSYCKPGYECKHNYTYWENKPFYAFGLGAASYLRGNRFSRPRKMKEYKGYVQRLEDGESDQSDASVVDSRDMASDIVMLSLRTARGLDLNAFREVYGDSLVSSLLKVYKPYMESGHVVCLDGNRNVLPVKDLSNVQAHGTEMKELASIRLSDPDGFLLSNELIAIAFGVISP